MSPVVRRAVRGGRGAAALAILMPIGVVIVAATTAVSGKAPKLSAWPTYGASLTSSNLVAPRGLTLKSATRMRAAWTRKVDGTVFASPLIGGSGAHRRVIVATEAGTVYALNADNGSVVWSRSITKPVSACGGSYGVTSAPGLDVADGLVYAIGASGYLTALSLADGSVRWRIRLVTRTGVEHVWSAVRLVGSSAYVAVASYCDAPDKNKKPPDGYLLRVDLGRHKVTAKFDVVPGPDNLGGIWGWGGISVDPARGAIFTSTGNAIVTSGGNLIEGAGHA